MEKVAGRLFWVLLFLFHRVVNFWVRRSSSDWLGFFLLLFLLLLFDRTRRRRRDANDPMAAAAAASWPKSWPAPADVAASRRPSTEFCCFFFLYLFPLFRFTWPICPSAPSFTEFSTWHFQVWAGFSIGLPSFAVFYLVFINNSNWFQPSWLWHPWYKLGLPSF